MKLPALFVALCAATAAAAFRVDLPSVQSQEYRNQSLKRAKVFVSEPQITADLSVSDTGPGSFKPDDLVECDWDFRQRATATTRKFYCAVRSPGPRTGAADVIKVKYSRDSINPHEEVFTTVLASRLMKVLGFASNRYFLVKRLRCYGCTADPFKDARHMSGLTRYELVRKNFVPDGNGQYAPDYSKFTDFTYVSILRKVGTEIQSYRHQGLGYDELSKIDVMSGATAPQIDAFRLLAVFMNHSDNHSSNQALVCLEKKKDIVTELGDDLGRTSACENPVVEIKDAGVTFGTGYGLFSPYRGLALNEWQKAKIWKNDNDCTVDIQGIRGNSFHAVRISEAGRREFANRLNTLSRQRVTDLFNGIDISTLPFRGHPEYNDVGAWVQVFFDKAQAINNKRCK